MCPGRRLESIPLTQRSIATRAVRGAVWKIGASLGSRAVGLLGTVVLTRFLPPSVMGEIAIATAVVITARSATRYGFGQYVMSRSDPSSETIFHAAFFNIVFGLVAFAGVAALAGSLARAFEAPGIATYATGLAFAALIARLGETPADILARQLRFGIVAFGVATGELTFTAVTLALAALGWGGQAVVMGGIARSTLRTALHLGSVRRRDWLVPCRLDRREIQSLLDFGLPLTVAGILGVAARHWDRLAFSSSLGVAVAGLYNLAFNLADIATTHVGEQVAEVLLPSYARLQPARRHQALKRAIGMIGLVVFPLAVGLGASAHTVVRVVFPVEWHAMAPMLAVLSPLSLVRPVQFSTDAYLLAQGQQRVLMVLQAAKLVLLLSAIWVLAGFGPLWACAGVGFAHAAYATASLGRAARVAGVSLWEMCRGGLGPLVACLPMTAVVLGVRMVCGGLGLGPSLVTLILEVGLGAMTYVVSVFVFARPQASELIQLAQRAFAERGARARD